MAGKCFIFAPIWLRCCVAYLTACSDIWVWPFCAARINHWNKSIDIRIIKPFTFRYIWKKKNGFMVQFFCFSTEWERADNDNQLVAISGMLDSDQLLNPHTGVCYEQCEEFIITTLSAGVEWLQAEMGPRKVWGHQETAHPVQTHLAPWHSAVQQVSLSTQTNGWTSFLTLNWWSVIKQIKHLKAADWHPRIAA